MEKRFEEVVSPSDEQMNTREEVGETAEITENVLSKIKMEPLQLLLPLS